MISPYIYAGTFANFKPLSRLSKELILRTICKELGMDFEEVKTKKTRLRKFVYARQLYAYFARIYTNESLTKIGKFINKDHATIIHSSTQIENFKEFDKEIRHHVRKLNNQLTHKMVNLTSDKREEIGNEIILKYQS